MQQLRRELGFFHLLLIGVGTIVGAGIYVLVGKVAGIAGYGAWLSFLVASLPVIAIGICYCRLVKKYPEAGGGFSYIYHAFGERFGDLAGAASIVGGLFVCATVSLGFGGYLYSIFPKIHPVLGAIIALTICLIISIIGIRETASAGILISLIEVGGLVIIILAGFPLIHVDVLFKNIDMLAVSRAAALILFAYIGFEEIVRFVEESKRVDYVWKALYGSIAVTTLLYVLTAAVAVSAVDPKTLAESPSPLAEVLSSILGEGAGRILGGIALLSTFNTILFSLAATARVLYDVGRKYDDLRIFSKVHPKFRTPHIATIVIYLLSVALAFTENIVAVASVTDFYFILLYLLVCAAAFKEGYKIEGLLGVIFSIIMLAMLRWDAIAIGAAILAVIYLASWVRRELFKGK